MGKALDFLLPQDSQPQEAAGVGASALAKGLIVAVNPAFGPVNLINGGPAITTVGAPAVGSVGASGRQVSGFSSSNYLSFVNALDANAPATIFMVCQNTSTANQGFNSFSSNSATGAQEHAPFGNVLYMSSLAAARYISGVSVPGGVDALLRPFSVAYTRSTGSLGVYYPTIRAYLNNVVLGSTSATAGSTAGTTFRIGSNSASSLAYVGGVPLFFMWDRELNAGELAELHANPWQLFEPQRIFIPVAEAGGGAFKPAWAIRNARTIGAGVI